MFRITIDEKYFLCPTEKTILEAARSQMVKVPYACAGGGCGFCKAKVIDGQYKMDRYAKSALSNEEAKNGYILLCKTRPLTDMQIDVNA